MAIILSACSSIPKEEPIENIEGVWRIDTTRSTEALQKKRLENGLEPLEMAAINGLMKEHEKSSLVISKDWVFFGSSKIGFGEEFMKAMEANYPKADRLDTNKYHKVIKNLYRPYFALKQKELSSEELATYLTEELGIPTTPEEMEEDEGDDDYNGIDALVDMFIVIDRDEN